MVAVTRASAGDSPHDGRVIIVGGGVIGASCAYYLRQAGCSVMLIDSAAFGRGCSHGNCGYVCPSHILPLAGPGAIRSALDSLFKRNSPLKVRWRLDPAFWSWFWQFSRRCNARDAVAAGHAIQHLLDSSRLLYDELFRATLTDCEWEPLGLLFVFLTAAAMEHYAETDWLLRREFGVGAVRFDAKELAYREPAIRPTVAGAWQYQSDGQLRPDKLMAAWRRVLEAAGVEIREHCAVAGSRERRTNRAPSRHSKWADCRRPDRRGHGSLDTATAALASPRDSHPARQRLLADDAAAGTMSAQPDDLRGASRRDHPDAKCTSSWFDDGVRRLRCAAQSTALAAPA